MPLPLVPPCGVVPGGGFAEAVRIAAEMGRPRRPRGGAAARASRLRRHPSAWMQLHPRRRSGACCSMAASRSGR
jgi:hypothetical protein